jgi:uncharacterized membrane protein YebE (DUF533 family)
MTVLTETGAFRARWSVLMVVVVAVVVGLGNVAYTNYVQRQADQRQAEQKAREERARKVSQQQTLRIVCAWMEPQVDPDPPPTTPRGRKQLAANQDFYEFLHCEGVK